MEKSRATRREVLQLLAVCGLPLAAAAPLRLYEPRESVKDVKFNEDWLRKVRRRRAEVAILGNSMVFLRLAVRSERGVIDPLDKLLLPLRTVEISQGGTRSLAWFLYLKNLVAACQPAPKVAFIFFRDYDLTNASMHIEGKHLRMLHEVMRPGDHELLRLARGDSAAEGWKAAFLERTTPEPASQQVRKKINDLAYDIAAMGAAQDTDVEQQVDFTFDFDHLRGDVKDEGAIANDSIDRDHAQFTPSPTSNLLTRFVEVAQRQGIKLVFYRVKRRPEANGLRPQDELLRHYMQDLRQWVESQNCVLIDETEDARITLSMYHDNDHLAAAARPQYTQWFVERVRHLLPAPFTEEELRSGSAAN